MVSSTNFEFKHMYGESRKQRLDAVIDLGTKNHIRSSELTKIQKAHNRNGRVLYDRGAIIAALVFRSCLTNDFAAMHYEKSFEIKALLLKNPTAANAGDVYSALIKKCLQKANELRALSMSIVIDSNDTALLAHVQQAGFRHVPEYHQEPLYVLSLQKKVTTMPLHQVPLKNEYLQLIQQGLKTIEGRIRSGMFLKMKAGDSIRFFNQRAEVTCTIRRITTYETFAKMLQTEGVQKCLPNVATIQKAISIYDSIPGYKEKASHYGVLAIEIAPITSS